MSKKKSFIFYYDWWDIFEPLSKEQKADLLTGIFDYIKKEKEPEYDELALKISFNIIRTTLNRDGEKYEKICQRNLDNGKKGGRPKKEIEYMETQKTQWVLKEPKKTQKTR